MVRNTSAIYFILFYFFCGCLLETDLKFLPQMFFSSALGGQESKGNPPDQPSRATSSVRCAARAVPDFTPRDHSSAPLTSRPPDASVPSSTPGPGPHAGQPYTSHARGTTCVFALAGSRARCPQKAGELHPTAQGQGPPFPESCVGHVGSSSEDRVYQGVAWMVRMAQTRPQLTCVFTPTGTGVLLDSFSLVIQETRFQALKLAWGKRPSRFRLAAEEEIH